MLTLLMLISHTISDFVLQTDTIVKLKSNMKIKGYFYHGLGLYLSSLFILLFINKNDMLNVLVIISIVVFIHLLLDFLKELIAKISSKLFTNEKVKIVEMVLFMLDQILHITVILIFTNEVTISFNFISDYLSNTLFSQGLTTSDLKFIFTILYISLSGAYFIPLIFNLVYAKVSDYSDILNESLKRGTNSSVHKLIDEVKTGKWIGILERILITIFIYNNQLSAIGFIIALKSLARFKMLDDKIFSEYYLLGTLLSVLYTFSVYEIIERIILL